MRRLLLFSGDGCIDVCNPPHRYFAHVISSCNSHEIESIGRTYTPWLGKTGPVVPNGRRPPVSACAVPRPPRDGGGRGSRDPPSDVLPRPGPLGNRVPAYTGPSRRPGSEDPSGPTYDICIHKGLRWSSRCRDEYGPDVHRCGPLETARARSSVLRRRPPTVGPTRPSEAEERPCNAMSWPASASHGLTWPCPRWSPGPPRQGDACPHPPRPPPASRPPPPRSPAHRPSG